MMDQSSRIRELERRSSDQERQLRQLGGGTVRQAVAGSSRSTNGTTLTDGCECSQTLFAEGVALTSGTPTVCCESHKRWTIDLGDTIGTKTLYHLTDDTWSTFNSDGNLDNPYEHDCGGSTDEYDVVMDLTSTGATITLEARAALNCDEVCFTYELAGTFACKGANRFKLAKFSNASELSLPQCVCLIPQVGTVECEQCAGGFGPDQVSVDFGTLTDFCDPPWNACAQASGAHVLERVSECHFEKELYDEVTEVAVRISATLGASLVRVHLERSLSGFAYASFALWELDVEAPYSCDSESFELTKDELEFFCSNNSLTDEACNSVPDMVTLVLPGVTPNDSGHCTPCGAA